MKNILLLSAVLTSLAACSVTPNKDMSPPKIGMANPASQYCVEQGGSLRSVMRQMVKLAIVS